MPEKIDIASHKIMSMEQEKREKILNAAMNEFRKGYKHASTDNIVREASISKGLLFHYFGTKEKLYEFLLWYTVDIMVTEYFGLMNFEQPDILDRICQMSLLKLDLSYKFPALFDFITAAYIAEKETPNSEISKLFASLQADLLTKAFINIDESLFKDGIDTKKAINLIWWTLSGYANSQVGESFRVEEYQKEYERYLTELKEYFEILRRAVYK